MIKINLKKTIQSIYMIKIPLLAVILSLSIINNKSYSNETKCVIEKVYNTESYKRSDINKTKNVNKIKNNQNNNKGIGAGKTITGNRLNNEIIPSKNLQEDTDTQCGVPV